jgi:hypothetical protein
MTTLLCMVLVPIVLSSLGRVVFCLKPVARAATERPDALERRVRLNAEENSVAVLFGREGKSLLYRIRMVLALDNWLAVKEDF